MTMTAAAGATVFSSAQRGEAVHAGQPHVEEDDVGRVRCGLREPVLGGRGDGDAVALALERPPQRPGDRLLVVDDQDGVSHAPILPETPHPDVRGGQNPFQPRVVRSPAPGDLLLLTDAPREPCPPELLAAPTSPVDTRCGPWSRRPAARLRRENYTPGGR